MRLEATRLNGRVVCQRISPLEILKFLVFAKVRSLKQLLNEDDLRPLLGGVADQRFRFG